MLAPEAIQAFAARPKGLRCIVGRSAYLTDWIVCLRMPAKGLKGWGRLGESSLQRLDWGFFRRHAADEWRPLVPVDLQGSRGRVTIGGQDYSEHYLASIARLLPEPEIWPDRVNRDWAPLPFRWSGGDGFLAPMMK